MTSTQFKKLILAFVLTTYALSSFPSDPVAPISNNEDGHCPYYEPGVKNLYWGDLHVHTKYSLDAYAFGTLKTPAEAYAFAKGKQMTLQDGSRVQLDRPLDFTAVTDHAEWFDLMHVCTDPQNLDAPYCNRLREDSSMEKGSAVFVDYVIPTITKASPAVTPVCAADPDRCKAATTSQWSRIQQQANDANNPCVFSAQIGYEWSYTKSFSHSHRNIIFANQNVTREAIDYIRYPHVKDLWQQLSVQCRPEDNCDVIAIPHNTNMGDGMTFDVETADQKSLYLRRKYERLVEIHQEKGNSECLSPLSTDESGDCGFENYITFHSRPKPKLEFTPTEWQKMRSTYVRSLLLRGLKAFEESGDKNNNPLQLGIIGSTDNHTATPGYVNEAAWQGAVFGLGDFDKTMSRRTFNPGGLVAVWAEENTRQSIFAALKRREVYATSGPRMWLKVIASTDGRALQCTDAGSHEPNTVRMGGEISKMSAPPYFKVQATADRHPLAKIEIIKGEYREGNLKESVVTIWNGGEKGNNVCQTWVDPDFDKNAPAFWYARVQEVAVPRWSSHRCQAKNKCKEFPGADIKIQERAWSSPIWYLPL
jgi:hypothetical protein